MRLSNFVVGLLTLSLPMLSHADVVFQTGFEPSPTETPGYMVGPLSGQNGWSSLTGPMVENTTVFSGSQAVSYSASGQFGQNEIAHPLSFNSLTHPNQLLVYNMEFMESATGTGSDWTVVATTSSNGFIGQIVVFGAIGKAGAGFGTLVPVTRGVWTTQ